MRFVSPSLRPGRAWPCSSTVSPPPNLCGARTTRPRWNRCVTYADADLGEAVGQKYVELTFGAQGKARTLRMVRQLEKALEEDIRSLDWMTPETKKRALEKLHAITERPADGRENPRFRDLIDLQLLEALDPDPRSVRDACERVFAARSRQPWPPTLVVEPSWPAAYAALAAELEFAITDVADAADAVRVYMTRIASA